MRTLGTARSAWALRDVTSAGSGWGLTHARSRRSTAALTLEVSTARSARSSTTELRSLRALATEVCGSWALGSGSRGSSAFGLTTELWGANTDTSLLGGAGCLTLGVRRSKGFALLRSA